MDLRVYRRTRSASTRLYTTISTQWTCGMHEQHSINMCPSEYESNTDSPHRTKFVLAIKPREDRPCQKETMWLDVIETENQGSSEDSDCGSVPSDQTRNAKRYKTDGLQDFAAFLEQGPRKVVVERGDQRKRNSRKRPPNTIYSLPNTKLKIVDLQNEPAGLTQSQPILDLQGLTSDLHSVSNHCLYFQNDCNHDRPRMNLAYLSETYIQRFSRSLSAQNAHNQSSSLYDLVTDGSDNDPIYAFSPGTTLDIGIALAKAVLHFYCTAWLPEDWGSRDIHFFNIAPNSEAQWNLQRPYLTLNFMKHENDKGKGKQKVTAEAIGSVQRPIPCQTSFVEDFQRARNPTLFRLGVILLEVGHSQPWETLRQKTSRQSSDYLAAEQLSRELLRPMGPAYSRIVRKCLGCDFGVGETDLDHEELQQTYINQVIEVLENTKQRLEGHSRNG